VILWVYPFKVLSPRKDENYYGGENYLTRWGILQYPYKALGRKHCSAFFFFKI
jgi:hypothetical protein